MALPATGRRATGLDQSAVHRWRVSQLARLGIPRPLAEAYAERVDWHQIARLVQRGCPRGWRCASSPDARREDRPR